jgi:hypothetical protein
MRVREVIQEYVETWLSILFGWTVGWFGYEQYLAHTSLVSPAFDYLLELLSKALIAGVSAVSAYLAVNLAKRILKHK